VTAGDVDPFALLTASEAASYCKVTVAAICNWYARGHLAAAKDDNGREIKVGGKRVYRLVDVAKADAKMAAQRERMALRLAGAGAALLPARAARGASSSGPGRPARRHAISSDFARSPGSCMRAAAPAALIPASRSCPY
jgi:hypothetical protein